MANGKAGAPFGNTNGAKKNFIFRDQIKHELTQDPNKVVKIVTKLIEDAIAGDHAARCLLFERIDGKVPQPLVGSEDDPPVFIKGLIDLVRPSSGS